jgi:hypothetical protein
MTKDYSSYVGKKFGAWLVLADEGVRQRKRVLLKCRCACGEVRQVSLESLNARTSKSCGCKVITHGLSYTAERGVYNLMVQRCHVKKSRQYSDYGGRGLRVCKRWLLPNGAGLKNFYADMGPRPAGYTLERRNNNKGYSPANCEWATRVKQQSNRRNSRPLFTFKGKTTSASQWAKRYGFAPSTVINRLDRGWTIKEALTTPVGAKIRTR